MNDVHLLLGWTLVSVLAGAMSLFLILHRRGEHNHPVLAAGLFVLAATGFSYSSWYAGAQEFDPALPEPTCWRSATGVIYCTDPEGRVSRCPELGPCELLIGDVDDVAPVPRPTVRRIRT